ncbi:MAG: YbaK/EbsC family protein [Candidatus Heimdallarchaeota archaeon]|nr:YbaK/EbsC family protein [Candidatus Heimdallarchaeota archaeon]
MDTQFTEPTSEKYELLLEWIEGYKSEGVERYEYEHPVRSVYEAVEVSGLKKGDFIKSICLKHKKEGTIVIAIILAGSKVNKKMIREGVSPKKWAMATPDQIFDAIGYPAGGVPPVCLPNAMSVYVDPRVLKREYVVGGGGTQSSLLKLPPKLILASGAEERIISIG